MDRKTESTESSWQQYGWEKGKFPQPKEVLEAALAKIESDGSVVCYEEDDDSWYRSEPHELVVVQDLLEWEYKNNLSEVAHVVEGHVANISLSQSHEVDRWLEILAHYLSAYRNEKDFLNEAVSLVILSDRGGLSVKQPE